MGEALSTSSLSADYLRKGSEGIGSSALQHRAHEGRSGSPLLAHGVRPVRFLREAPDHHVVVDGQARLHQRLS